MSAFFTSGGGFDDNNMEKALPEETQMLMASPVLIPKNQGEFFLAFAKIVIWNSRPTLDRCKINFP